MIMKLQHEPVVFDSFAPEYAHAGPHQIRAAAGVAKGAYVLADAAGGKPEVILIGTGSEVACAWTPTRS